MTATSSTDHHPSVLPMANLSAEEFAALDQEDVQAGRLVGRLLAFFFLYTIVVTPLAAWWTWYAIR